MKKAQVNTIGHGLYVIHWKSGGKSLASVGSDALGRRWFAPCNWLMGAVSHDWKSVEKVKLIRAVGD